MRKIKRERKQREHEGVVTKSERVMTIARLMASFGYHGQVTLDHLNASWNVSQASLEADAAEASRLVRAVVKDGDELREQASQALAMIIQRCSELGAVHPNYFKVALESIQALCALRRVAEPEKPKDDVPVVQLSSEAVVRMAEAVLAKKKGKP